MRVVHLAFLLSLVAVHGCSVAGSQAGIAGSDLGGTTHDGTLYSFRTPGYMKLSSGPDELGKVTFAGSDSCQFLVSSSPSKIPDTATFWVFDEKVIKENSSFEIIYSEPIQFGTKTGYRLLYSQRLNSDPKVTGSCNIIVNTTMYSVFYQYKKSDPKAGQFDKDMKALMASWVWKV